MESFSKRRKLFIRNICACCTIAAIMLYGCGGSNSSSADQKKQYGTVSLGLQFERNSAHNLSMDNGRSVAGPNICEDFNIDVVDVQIFWPDGQSVVAISWACSDHQGTIRQVPVGSDFSLVCTGIVDGEPQWRGEIGQVAVLAGQTTQVDPIAMRYMGADHSPPELFYTLPAAGAENVALNSSIVAVVNEPLAASSVSDDLFIVTADGVPISGQVTFSRSLNAISFKPYERFDPSKTYSVVFNSNRTDETGFMDCAGNVCGQDYSWSFMTSSETDSKAPQISATIPGAGTNKVDVQTAISVSFDEPLNPGVLNNEVFTITSDQDMVGGQIAYDNPTNTLSFTPDEPLAYLTDYTVTLNSGIQDMAGNLFEAVPYSWGFRTNETQFELSIVKEGSGAGTITSTPVGIDCGNQCTAQFTQDTPIVLLPAPDSGSVFAGWSGQACSGNVSCEFSILEDTSITADFALKTYTISAASAAGGSIQPVGNVIVDYGAGVTFEIEPDQGYYLADLRVDGSSIAPTMVYDFSAVNQNHTIQAVFSPVKFVDNQVGQSGNGQKWETAFKTIQEAVNHSNPGDEIWIRTDSYYVTSPIVLDKALILRGGFDATETLPEQRPEGSFTTIDGQQTVSCVHSTADTQFENFIFNNGTSSNGGGLYCTAKTTLENCIISNCRADNGGGIYSTRQLDLTGCQFSNNSAIEGVGGSGGAVFVQGQENNRASLYVRGCLFVDNSSYYLDIYEGGLSGGGAIFSNYSDALLISESSFSQNLGYHGGAVYLVNGNTASIEGCRFENNSSREPAGQGGAIYNNACILQVSESLFTGNSGFDGGAIFAHPSTIDSNGVNVILNSIFSGNKSSDSGGAVHIEEGRLRLVNDLFFANNGYCAGAVCADDRVLLSIVNNTVVDNTGNTGGIRAISSTSIINSILWDNQSNANPDTTQISTSMAVQYSDINQDGYEGIQGNIRVEPSFVDSVNSDFHLQSGTDCVDHGNNDAEYLPGTDLDGNNRIIGTKVDMGVYEK